MANRSGRDATSGAGTGLPPLRDKLSLQRTWGCVRHLQGGRQLNLCLPKFIFFKNMHDVHSFLPQTRCIPPVLRRTDRRTLAAIGFFMMASRVSFLFSKCSNPVEKPAETTSSGRFQDLAPLSISARRLDMYVATMPPTAAFHPLRRMSHRHG
jgi:hypothetical protein